MTEKQSFNRQDGFQISWKPQPQKSTALPDGFHAMRDWQIQAFDELKYAPHVILNAPVGKRKRGRTNEPNPKKIKHVG